MEIIAKRAARAVWRTIYPAAAHHLSIEVSDLVSEAWLGMLRAVEIHGVDCALPLLRRWAYGKAQESVRNMDPVARSQRTRARREGRATPITVGFEDLGRSDWARDRYMPVADFAAGPFVDGMSDRREVSAALLHLSHLDQDLIRRRYRDEQTLAEIAEVYGCTEAWVSRLHKQALLRLRKHLEHGRRAPNQ